MDLVQLQNAVLRNWRRSLVEFLIKQNLFHVMIAQLVWPMSTLSCEIQVTLCVDFFGILFATILKKTFIQQNGIIIQILVMIIFKLSTIIKNTSTTYYNVKQINQIKW